MIGLNDMQNVPPLAFPTPAYLEKDLVTLHTVCRNPAEEVVCEGEALVWVGDLEG